MANLPVVTVADSAFQKWKAFLEGSPANSPLSISGLASNLDNYNRRRLPDPRLQMHCPIDGGVRWFETAEMTTLARATRYEFIAYTCRDCGKYVKTFAVLIVRKSDDAVDAEVMKLGEYPPFAAPVSSRIAKLLTKDELELFRQGTRSEAQGLGIGAATYFRRIVESQWQLLVKEIRAVAERLGEKDLTIYEDVLKETQFSNAVEKLKGRLPAKLLILNGQNPLTLLYKPLSVGLHGLTDAECLQQAADIRTVLTALLENIADVLKEQNELKDAAARLSQIT